MLLPILLSSLAIATPPGESELQELDVDLPSEAEPVSRATGNLRAPYRLANAGCVTMVVGIGVSGASLPILLTAEGSWPNILLGVGVLTLGASTAHIGHVLMTAADLDLAYRIRHRTGNAGIILGWTSAGMVVTGTILFAASSLGHESAGQVIGGTLVGTAMIPATIAHLELRTDTGLSGLALTPALLPVITAGGEMEALPGFSMSASW